MVSGIIGNGGAAGANPRSACVNTATTPGDASASAVSIETIRACAIVDRTNVRCSAPASAGSCIATSSTYWPPTVNSAGSSLRTTRLPKMLVLTGSL